MAHARKSKPVDIVPMIRPIMQAVVSLGLLVPSVVVICYGGPNQPWAIGIVGMIAGYWLKR